MQCVRGSQRSDRENVVERRNHPKPSYNGFVTENAPKESFRAKPIAYILMLNGILEFFISYLLFIHRRATLGGTFFFLSFECLKDELLDETT